MQTVKHGCTLDCFDCCKFDVFVEKGKIIKIEGDKTHPYTRGFICNKGKKHLERQFHEKRILKPRKKINQKWMEIDFREALEIVKDKLLYYREKYGSNSVVHYAESGSGGLLKAIEDVFFNFYGGVTLSRGSICWGAGIAAQKYDFGDVKGHYLEDILNSKCVILWGRNPANTSLHLAKMIQEAKKGDTKIVVIDPVSTDSARIADIYVRINPSSDGALAMAMTKIIIEEGLLDLNFINNHIKGFNEYKIYLNTLDLSYISAETGLSRESIRELALMYGGKKPAAIYPGYGLQRYKNGGNTIRAIDALAAITGNVGKRGGGVNYANKIYPKLLNSDPYHSSRYARNKRFFDISGFSDFISKENNPPVKAFFISKANPLAQLPNLNKTIQAFNEVEFKVCIDMFMTDTAERCDLFIPCTNTLESEDLLYTSMGNPYITYNEKVLEPADPLMDEYYFFQELARLMELKSYPLISKREYLDKVIEPLKEKGISLDQLKDENITLQQESTAWRNFDFTTPSGKIEIYSEKAARDGLSPIPVYISVNKGLRLITGHPRESIFTQHFLDTEGLSKAYINQELAQKHSINEGDAVILSSSFGRIEVQAGISSKVPADVVYMYTGWWQKHGNPNFLTSEVTSDMGGLVAYNETIVEIEKRGN